MIIRRLLSPFFVAALRLSLFALIPLFSLCVFFALTVGSVVPERLVWFTSAYRVGVIDAERGTLFLYPPSMPLRPDLPVGDVAITIGHTIRTYTRDLMPAFSRAMPVENLPLACDVWSPDAAYLLCIGRSGQNYAVWVYSGTHGHLPIVQIEDPIARLNAAMSPDGDQIAVTFSTENPDRTLVDLVQLPEGTRTQIGEYALSELFLRWSGDTLLGALPNTLGRQTLTLTLIEDAAHRTTAPPEIIVVVTSSSRLFTTPDSQWLLLTSRFERYSERVRTTLEIIDQRTLDRITIYHGAIGFSRLVAVQSDDDQPIYYVQETLR